MQHLPRTNKTQLCKKKKKNEKKVVVSVESLNVEKGRKFIRVVEVERKEKVRLSGRESLDREMSCCYGDLQDSKRVEWRFGRLKHLKIEGRRQVFDNKIVSPTIFIA
ncbi:hypothetical protein Tco_1430323 [Tanacetum coccineum]